MENLKENPTQLDLFSTQDLLNALSIRGYNVNLAKDMISFNSLIHKAYMSSNWDDVVGENGDEYKLGDYCYSQLDKIKDNVSGINKDNVLDIINNLQETIVPILNF